MLFDGSLILQDNGRDFSRGENHKQKIYMAHYVVPVTCVESKVFCLHRQSRGCRTG